jgi:hypothetical protein
VTTQACTAPSGYTADSTDCRDNSSAINPGATEVCNGIDDDCDGTVDEGVKNTYYRDADNDTYGNAAVTTQGCAVPAGYVTDSTDCNDGDAQVHENCATCQLQVFPKNLHKVLGGFEPFKVFVLVGSGSTEFGRDDVPVWSSDAIANVLKVKFGKRTIIAIVMVRPIFLEPGESQVRVGDCAGSFEIKKF